MKNALRRHPASAGPAQAARLLILLLILLAFARLLWQLDAKNLWWDESLSLQRAESGWWPLLAGHLYIDDSLTRQLTRDQHPFGFFVILGVLVRLAGESEFVLRFPAAMAATLLVPGLWALARLFVRRAVLPPTTPALAALLAAASPFYLWYGQEARMYTLTALLAVLSTYALLRWQETAPGRARVGRLLVYLFSAALFTVSHYFAGLLLPIHGLVLVLGIKRRRLALALVAAGLLAVAGAVGYAVWLILQQPHSGANFVSLPFSILLPDLLNAYSLGLSVNIETVWWLDVGFGLLALAGGLWSLRGHRWRAGGWLLTGLLVGPVLLLVLVNQIQPAYMNARHLSVISGFFLLLVAGGIGLVWQRSRVGGALLGLVLVGAMGYSSVNYFSQPIYGKDDFAGVGAVLRREMMPGDALLLNPPHMQRLFRYYLPVDRIEAAHAAGATVHWWGMPVFFAWEKSEAVLGGLHQNYRRVWLVTSQMYPYADPERQVEGWLSRNGLRIREQSFYSPNSILELDLFLLGGAVADALPDRAVPVGATFDDAIELAGYTPGRPLWPGAVTPVTFYWRGLRALDQRYKYIASVTPAGAPPDRVSPVTEREFYDGFLPSLWWTPGTLIVEESQLDTGAGVDAAPGRDTDGILSLQLYGAESQVKLPVIADGVGSPGTDGTTLNLAFPLFSPEFGETPEN